jgi:hypothetical protein
MFYMKIKYLTEIQALFEIYIYIYIYNIQSQNKINITKQ